LILVLDELEEFLLYINHDEEDDDEDKKEKNDNETLNIKNKEANKKYRMRYRNTKKRWARLIETIRQKKHVILVLTTNKDKSFFDNIDNALLREYRVSMNLKYTNDSVCIVPFVEESENVKEKEE
jgi:FtsZ-interacting cell division protein YlmF